MQVRLYLYHLEFLSTMIYLGIYPFMYIIGEYASNIHTHTPKIHEMLAYSWCVVCTYIYIYIYVCVCVCVCIYIYTYIVV